MSSLTDVSDTPLSPRAARAARRARLAPLIMIVFAMGLVAVLVAFAFQAGFFDLFAPEPPKPAPIQPTSQMTSSNSTITGFDRQKRPYSVTAVSAMQDKDVASHIHLTTVSGESQRSNGQKIEMKANTGLYDTEQRLLDLEGAVQIISAGRFTAFMDKARVIVHEKKLTTSSPVHVDLPNGTIDSNGMEISNDGDNVLFLNGVRARFTNTSTKGGNTP
jgi:lipopolysaccharide export system protein LptC